MGASSRGSGATQDRDNGLNGGLTSPEVGAASSGVVQRREGTAWPRWLLVRGRLRRVRCHRGKGRRFGDRPGNMANPMAGCGAQQTRRAARRGNRRSREERQGRNEHGPWQVGAEGSGDTRDREWMRAARVGGGAVLDEPHERSLLVPACRVISGPREPACASEGGCDCDRVSWFPRARRRLQRELQWWERPNDPPRFRAPMTCLQAIGRSSRRNSTGGRRHPQGWRPLRFDA